MQITVPRNELKEAVAGFSKIVNGKSQTLPVLGCVRFASTATGVTAEVTDLDQTARYHFGAAEASDGGAFVVPLASIKDLAKGKDRETVVFETGEASAVTITNHVGEHAVRHPLAGMDVDEWPVCPADLPTEPAAGFLETYRRLTPFASSDPTRYTIGGVFVDVAEKGDHPVTMVATDGRRLSLWNSMNLPLAQSVIIPTTKFLQWNGLTGEAGLALRVARQNKETRIQGVAVRVGPWFYEVRAIEGAYPNFRQVVPSYPEDDAQRITFTDDDVAALRKILPTFPGTGTPNAGIVLRAGPEGRLTIAGRERDDKTETTLELAGGSRFEGTMPGVGVNSHYLLEALDAGFRTFTTTDELNPLKSQDGRGGIHVLMPLRLDPTPTAKAEPTPPEPQAEPAPPVDTETTTPVPEPADPKTPPKKEPKTMNKEPNGTQTAEPAAALDKVLLAIDTAKGKLREAATALVEVADAVKTAVRDGKAQSADLEKARATLQKLQAINL